MAEKMDTGEEGGDKGNLDYTGASTLLLTGASEINGGELIGNYDW